MKTGSQSTWNLKQLATSTLQSREKCVRTANLLYFYMIQEPNLGNGAAHGGLSLLMLTVKTNHHTVLPLPLLPSLFFLSLSPSLSLSSPPSLSFPLPPLMYILSISSVLENSVYFSRDIQPQRLFGGSVMGWPAAPEGSVEDHVAESPMLERGALSYLHCYLSPHPLRLTEKKDQRTCLGERGHVVDSASLVYVCHRVCHPERLDLFLSCFSISTNACGTLVCARTCLTYVWARKCGGACTGGLHAGLSCTEP